MKKYLPVVMLVLALALSACNFHFKTDISKDMSGTFAFIMDFTADDVETLTAMGSAPSDLCNELKADAAADEESDAVVTYVENDDGSVACETRIPFADLDELSRVYQDMDFTVNRLEVADKTLYYDVMVTMDDENAMGGFVNIIWDVTFPGKVVQHNGTSQQGNTVTWDFGDASSMRVTAESKVGGMNSLVVGILVAVVLLALMIGAGVFAYAMMTKKPQPEPSADMPAQPPAAPEA